MGCGVDDQASSRTRRKEFLLGDFVVGKARGPMNDAGTKRILYSFCDSVTLLEIFLERVSVCSWSGPLQIVGGRHVWFCGVEAHKAWQIEMDGEKGAAEDFSFAFRYG